MTRFEPKLTVFPAVSLALLVGLSEPARADCSSGTPPAGIVCPTVVISQSSDANLNYLVAQGLAFDNVAAESIAPYGVYSLSSAGVPLAWSGYNTPVSFTSGLTSALQGISISPTVHGNGADQIWAYSTLVGGETKFWKNIFLAHSGGAATAGTWTYENEVPDFAGILVAGIDVNMANEVYITRSSPGWAQPSCTTNANCPPTEDCDVYSNTCICSSSAYLYQRSTTNNDWQAVEGPAVNGLTASSADTNMCVQSMAISSDSGGLLWVLDPNGIQRYMLSTGFDASPAWSSGSTLTGVASKPAAATAHGTETVTASTGQMNYMVGLNPAEILNSVLPTSGNCTGPDGPVPCSKCQVDVLTSVTFDYNTGDLYWSTDDYSVCKWTACELEVAITCAVGGSCSVSGC